MRKKQVALRGKRAEQAKGKSPDAAERKSVSNAAKLSGTAEGSGREEEGAAKEAGQSGGPRAKSTKAGS